MFSNLAYIPTWSQTKLIVKSDIFKVSPFIIVVVPIIARINAAITQGSPWISQFLDFVPGNIPLNLLRIFWSAMLIIIAHVAFRAMAPKIISNYEDRSEWCNKSERAKTMLASSDITTVEAEYDKCVGPADTEGPVKRTFVLLFVALAAYLSLRVLIDQLVVVYKCTDLTRVFGL